MADPGDWHAANLRLSLSESLSLLAGPAVGGLLIGAASLVGALVLDGVTYGVSVLTLVVLVAGLRRSVGGRPGTPVPRVRMRVLIVGGFRYVTTQPVLRGIMWAGAAYNVGSAMFESMLVLYAVDDLASRPAGWDWRWGSARRATRSAGCCPGR